MPLLRDGTTIGVFTLGRHEVKPFTDKQIELVTTFADQAVIAIENARLFEAEQQRTRELTESLQQQSATVVTSSICFSLNGLTSSRVSERTPIIVPSRRSGTPRIVLYPNAC